MLYKLKQWIDNKRPMLETLGIETDNFFETPEDVPNPSIRVDHISPHSIGRITAWSTNNIELVVLDFETEQVKHTESIEIESENIDFDALYRKYISALITY